jgi:hypothetical protein
MVSGADVSFHEGVMRLPGRKLILILGKTLVARKGDVRMPQLDVALVPFWEEMLVNYRLQITKDAGLTTL